MANAVANAKLKLIGLKIVKNTKIHSLLDTFSLKEHDI